LNEAALADLPAWVPDLFPDLDLTQRDDGGYRITSKQLNRDLEEDLAITPDGIKDFGVHDMGDERKGKRTAIDLVMEHSQPARDKHEAFEWLRLRLGLETESDGCNEEAVAAAFDTGAKGDACHDGADPKPDEPDSAPMLSEDYLALQFTKAHAGTLRYVAAWSKWLIYDGKKWSVDEKLKAFTMARQICRTAAKASTSNTKKEAKTIASAKTRSAVVSLASADPCHAASTDQWDKDPWLLNTPGGVVDLRIGQLREHRATDYMRKTTAVTPDFTMPIPLFQTFLKRITNNDVELEKFIQRAHGYSLTGLTIEEVLFFCYGEGANGKSVLNNTISKVQGDYATAASFETFAASKGGYDRHPTELADLQGVRLVMVPETEKDRHWNETRIKQITGGDSMKARFMRQDLFEFDPICKLWFSG
jgi:phage/plasmid-associated DNA primase